MWWVMVPNLRTAVLGFVRIGYLESLHVHPEKAGFDILAVFVEWLDRKDCVAHLNSTVLAEMTVVGSLLVDMVVSRHSYFADHDDAVTGTPNRL